MLRRLERDSLLACVAMAGIGLIGRKGDPDGAIGVLAGGALVAGSYLAIKGGIDAMMGARPAAAAGHGGRRLAWPLVKFFTRYAILAIAAYVVLVPFRLHPAGVVAGASSVVVAAALEALRSVRAHSRRSEHSR